MEMEETNGLRQAQVQRDNFVPDVPEGKGGWCPKCGAWRPGPVCGACRRRESVLAVLWPQREGFLAWWFGNCRNQAEILGEAYQARRRRFLREGNRLGLLGLEQAEREFAQGLGWKEEFDEGEGET